MFLYVFLTFLLAVDFPAVTDGENMHLTTTVIDFVQDAILAHPDTPLVAAAGQFLGVSRARLRAKSVDGGTDAAGDARRQVGKFLQSTTFDENLITQGLTWS